MSSYSTLLPTNDVVAYTSATPQTDYPVTTAINTFGPVHAPKLHAFELDALELASSGKIAVTLQDEHAFDIVDNSSDVILFTARDNNSFKWMTEGSEAHISIDTSGDVTTVGSNNIDMTAGNTISAAATNNVSIQSSAAEIVLSAATVIDADATTIDMDASDTLSATAVNKATLESTSADVDINAATAITADAGSTLTLTSAAAAYQS